MTDEWGALSGLARLAIATAAALALLAVLYFQLYRVVRKRGLSENLILFGFSPLLILPALCFAWMYSSAEPPAPDTPPDGGVCISALDNHALLCTTAIFGLFPPLIMNVMAWVAMRYVPWRVDDQGVLMRNQRRHRWSDCAYYTPFSTYLRLTFSSGVVRLQRPVRSDTAEFLFTLRMLDRHGIHRG